MASDPDSTREKPELLVIDPRHGHRGLWAEQLSQSQSDLAVCKHNYGNATNVGCWGSSRAGGAIRAQVQSLQTLVPVKLPELTRSRCAAQGSGRLDGWAATEPATEPATRTTGRRSACLRNSVRCPAAAADSFWCLCHHRGSALSFIVIIVTQRQHER